MCSPCDYTHLCAQRARDEHPSPRGAWLVEPDQLRRPGSSTGPQLTYTSILTVLDQDVIQLDVPCYDIIWFSVGNHGINFYGELALDSTDYWMTVVQA